MMKNSFSHFFAEGLLAPEHPVPDDVTSYNGSDVLSRYNVYRNNVIVSLINALASIYPVVQRLTGEDFFRALARSYVRKSPPVSRLLWEYGSGFPEFIETYKYASQVPWLSDIARIERAWLNAWHAADDPILLQNDLAYVPEDELMNVRFSAHPSSSLLRSPWPVMSIYSLNRYTPQTEQFSSDAAEDVLITRPGDDVLVTLLPDGMGGFLQLLLNGCTLGEAVEASFHETRTFNLMTSLAVMISTGVFSSVNKD